MAQQGSSRPFRPIAPRTSSAGPASGAPGSNNDENKLKRASMACRECKRRRTKCSFDTPGGPCYECTLQGSGCIVDESADKRRKVAIKRAEEDARVAQEGARRAEESERLALGRERRHKMNEGFYHRFLCQLLQGIRVGGPEAVAAIVSVIKSTESQDQIQNVVSECLAHHAFHYGAKNENLADGMIPDGPMPYFLPDGPM